MNTWMGVANLVVGIAVLLTLVLGVFPKLKEIKEFMATNTQALADLQAAVATMQNSIANLQSADTLLDAAIQKLSAGGVSPADIEAVVAQLNAASASLKPVVDDLNAQATKINPPEPVAVSVSPATATIAVGATQQFSASVIGSTNTAVTWSASTGSIDPTGLFTAPATAGSAIITATSQADATKSATASVSFA
jgi:uncharacterized protein YjdB